jgi:urease accessory protein
LSRKQEFVGIATCPALAQFIWPRPALDIESPFRNAAAMKIRRFLPVILLSLCATPSVVHAHVMPGQASGFGGGLAHPFLGLDHILAMLAVGLWAFQLGGRATWCVPAAFVAAMITGGVAGIHGVHLPLAEQGVVFSVVVLGVLIAGSVRLPVVVSTALVGLFAVFHGYCHASEMSANISALAYTAGFALATVALYACGIALGLCARSVISEKALRYAGAAIVLAGIAIYR